MRVALDAAGFGINQVDLPAGASGREHDESGSGQEEVPLEPGVWLRVDAAHTGLPVAGPGGLSFIAIGGRPGAAYVPSPGL
jgi:hypothetical protein